MNTEIKRTNSEKHQNQHQQNVDKCEKLRNENSKETFPDLKKFLA